MKALLKGCTAATHPARVHAAAHRVRRTAWGPLGELDQPLEMEGV